MSFLAALKRRLKGSFAYFLANTLRNAVKLASFRSRYGIDALPFPAKSGASDMPIDIVIPVIDKDAATLPFVIDSAREHIKHPISQIYLVCPSGSSAVKRIAAEKGCAAVDEEPLVPTSPKLIKYVCDGRDRSGWVYQQLLKWSGGKFCSEQHYLVMDSDTVFLRPQVFEIGGKIVFDACDGIHRPYFSAFERIFGMKADSTLSFTSHHALISVPVMKEIFDYLEAASGKEWFKAIVDSIDERENSCVSDYDNYGLYFMKTRPERMLVRYWYNKSIRRSLVGEIDGLRAKYGRYYATLSLHAYSD